MNLEKLKSLGAQKAITACIRHSKAMERGSHTQAHQNLRNQCDALANELWNALPAVEQLRLDLSAKSETEINH